MSKPKILVVMLLTLSLLVLQFGTALASSVAQTSLTAGTVKNITLETDPDTRVVTVLVTILDSAGVSQILRINVETALSLGLVNLDPSSGLPKENPAAIGTQITMDPATILSDTTDQHPVGSALAEFFGELLGVDYETIIGYHEQGVGFGVIAQALWMTKKLEGDGTVFAAILDARKFGDYSSITMPDGSTPHNWGQFRKALLSGDKLANLGAIMSGRAFGENNTQATLPEQGQGHGRGHRKGKAPSR